VLTGLIVLLACQLVGELVVRTLDLPLPGPILGMVLLFVLLQVRRPAPTSALVQAPRTLLRYLPLLYVPAGVGVIAYLTRLREDALAISVGLVGSWVAGLAATALVTSFVLRLTGQRRVQR
jgi:holin-like protein